MTTAGAASGHEVEIKLPAPDLEEIRRRLGANRARLMTALHFESNDLFDDEAGSLAKRGCALRLRRTDAGARLTFKGPARFESGVKIREERETEVSDPAETERILGALGYHRCFRYEKRREEWSLEGCAISLDETPIGAFVEIEGDPLSIRHALRSLGLDSSQSLPYSYAELYARRRREDPTLPQDMVLRNS